MTASQFLRGLPAAESLETRAGPVTLVDHGDGPPVLALHGAMGGWDQGAILARAVFAAEYRVLAPSRPGYPGTPQLGALTAAQQADRMIALLEALGVGPATIVAISGGGPCAVRMAVARPDLCSAMLLISTVSEPNPIDIPARFRLLKLMARIPGLPAALRRGVLKRFEAAAARAFPDPAMRARVMDDPITRDLYLALTESGFSDMGARVAASVNDFHVTATETLPLEALRVPTLVVHADNDPYVNFERHALGAQRRIPRAELLRLGGGGHAAIFPHRREVAAAVESFLARTRLSEAGPVSPS